MVILSWKYILGRKNVGMIDMTAFMSLPMLLQLLGCDNVVSVVIFGVGFIVGSSYLSWVHSGVSLFIGSSCGYSWVFWKLSFLGFTVFLDFFEIVILAFCGATNVISWYHWCL